MEEKPLEGSSMTHLEKLVLGEDDSPMQTDDQPKESLLDDNTPLPQTRLGKYLDELMVVWCQMMKSVSTKPPAPPPTSPEHVKEVAELWVKDWRVAALDLNTELTRISLQWEQQHPEEYHEDEMKSIDEALERQDNLLKRCQTVLENRTDVFFSKPK
ncbi:unnamed protein product [Auanema sp. JU1783]|nr:unnamed protein product [Auanema sp. JU1783]